MNISKHNEGSTLTMEISGRLDTTTAPELEKEIGASCEGTEKLILDLKKLEYVSSAGLRVFLSTHKKMSKQGSMVIRNANPDIMEIFDVTGFSDILNLE